MSMSTGHERKPTAQVARWEARIEEFAAAARDAQDRANRAEEALRECREMACGRAPCRPQGGVWGPDIITIAAKHGVTL